VTAPDERGDAADRFLIVRLGALGDVVHAIPAAAAIRAQNPDARIDWLVEPRYVPLLQMVRGLNQIVPVDVRRGARHVLSTLGALRRTRYDAAFDLQGLLKSAALARLAGARLTVGFPSAHLREAIARVCYSRTPDPGSAVHVVHKNLALLGAIGVQAAPVQFPLEVPETAASAALIAQHGAGGYLLMNPGAAWPNKRWPPARFGLVAAAIRAQVGTPSVVLWGPGEEGTAAAVVAASAGAAVAAPPTSIVDVCAIARGAAVMLSGDTGPLHLAAAMGTAVVALFGPTRAERNGPWNPEDRVVARTDRCECLYERTCRRAARTPPGVPCIEEVAVSDVVGAVSDRMRAGEARVRVDC
jgi:heptosyltransferase-1